VSGSKKKTGREGSATAPKEVEEPAAGRED